MQYFFYVFLQQITFDKLAFLFFLFHICVSIFPQSACVKLTANVVSSPWYFPPDIENALRLKQRAELDVLRASSSMHCNVN